jgi:hypothetical protein
LVCKRIFGISRHALLEATGTFVFDQIDGNPIPPAAGYFSIDLATTQGPSSDPVGTFNAENIDTPGVWSITTSVPESSTWAMMILGFVGLVLMAYRRKKADGCSRRSFQCAKTLIFIAGSVIVAVFAPRAQASTYLVDLNKPGGAFGTSGSLSYNPGCYCGEGITETYSSLYHFASGSVVDFGTLEIFAVDYGQSTPDGGPTQGNLYLAGASLFVNVSFSSTPGAPTPPTYPYNNFTYFSCAIDDASCNSQAQNYAYLNNLIFTIPAGADSIQLNWSAAGPASALMASIPRAF